MVLLRIQMASVLGSEGSFLRMVSTLRTSSTDFVPFKLKVASTPELLVLPANPKRLNHGFEVQ
jgi:hypothetical protein